MKDTNDRSLRPPEFTPAADDETIICRCEGISKGEIRGAIHDGMYTITEIKRFIRPGMGPCQGQRCGPLVRRIVSQELGVAPDLIELPTSRPPVKPTKMQTLADEIIIREESK